ncbi:hypothetical protein SK854_36425 [Lentzea sp. BCCO 10_0061]|uniref:Uncharacterized protein n=1 Tax=Lentzea sokolovensis TaxID=3095429 RepID=A0ABU4V836_9PSEU|nr:hypothetical protein [Lentzea sp. BCCO 10_0061]MDX8147645.1 hypothetical protein [Lentzea sp. BCCO 10_0061]
MQETWLVEDEVPRVLRLLEQPQRRWEVDGEWSWIMERPDETR